jgi:hypothetical protein
MTTKRKIAEETEKLKKKLEKRDEELEMSKKINEYFKKMKL